MVCLFSSKTLAHNDRTKLFVSCVCEISLEIGTQRLSRHPRSLSLSPHALVHTCLNIMDPSEGPSVCFRLPAVRCPSDFFQDFLMRPLATEHWQLSGGFLSLGVGLL